MTCLGKEKTWGINQEFCTTQLQGPNLNTILQKVIIICRAVSFITFVKVEKEYQAFGINLTLQYVKWVRLIIFHSNFML